MAKFVFCVLMLGRGERGGSVIASAFRFLLMRLLEEAEAGSHSRDDTERIIIYLAY